MNSELENKTHLTYEHLLDYLERRLAPDDVRFVENHLATECSACQSDLDWLSNTLKLMASDIWLEPPQRLSNTAHQVFRENRPETKPAFSLGSWLQSLWPQPKPVAIAFAAILVIVIGIGLYLRTQLPISMDQEVSVAAAEGTVLALPPDSESWQPLTEDGVLDAGTQVQTGEDSSVVLTFPDDSKTVAAPNTELEIVRMSSLPNGSRGVIVMSQTLGQTVNVVQTSESANSRFEIRTPSARVVVRGTEFTVSVNELGATEVAVNEGVVEVIAMGTTVFVSAGESTMVLPGQEPTAPTTIPALPTEESPGESPGSEPIDSVPDSNPPTEEGATRELNATNTPVPQSTPAATSTPNPTATPPPTSGGDGPTPPPPTATNPPPTATNPPPTATVPPPSPSPTMPPPADTPTPDSGTHVPPGLTKTPQPPGQTKTPAAASIGKSNKIK